MSVDSKRMASMALRATVLAAVALLGACAGTGGRDNVLVAADEATDKAMHLDLIRKMLDQQQYYAALAHIEQQQRATGNNDQLRYLEAEARRQLGQTTAAESLYRGLLQGRLAGKAYHGLGLLYASRNLATSVQYLGEAARRNPTDAKIRNDYGYALLRASRYREALPELSTAVELDPASERPRNNLLLLLMVMRDETRVQQVINEAGVPAETVARLRRNAQAMQARKAGTGVKK